MKKFLLSVILIITASHLHAEGTPKPGILVYPFRYSGDAGGEWEAQGIPRSFFINLMYCRGIVSTDDGDIRIVETDREIAGLASFMGFDIVLTGDVKSVKGSLSISARIIDAATGETLCKTGAGGRVNDIFNLQEKLFFNLMDAASKLKLKGVPQVRLTADESAMIKSIHRPDPEAFRLYSIAAGKFYSDPAGALIFIRRSIMKDDNNAAALIMAGRISGSVLNLSEEGMEYFHRAEKILKKSGHGKTDLYIYLLNCKAMLYVDMGDDQRALDLVQNIKSTLEKNNRKNTRAYAETLGILAVIHSNRNETDYALNYYSEAKKTVEGLGLPNSQLAATILHNIGTEYYRLELYDVSIDYYTRALAIDERTCNESESRAITYSSMGNAYRGLGDSEKFFEYYNRARAVLERLGLTKNKDYSAIMNNLGLAYLESGDHNTALKNFIIAERIESSLGLENTAGYAITMANLGYVYNAREDYEKAAEYLYRARSIRIRTKNNTDVYYAALVSTLAKVELKRGNYNSSWSLFFETKDLCETFSFTESMFYADTLSGMGLLCDTTAEYTMSLYYYEKSAGLMAKTGRDETEYYANLLRSIAGIHARLGQIEKAAIFYKKSAEVYENAGFDEERDSVLKEMEENRQGRP